MCYPSPTWVLSPVTINRFFSPFCLSIFNSMEWYYVLGHISAKCWWILLQYGSFLSCGVGPKNPNSPKAESSGSDQKPRPKSPRASPDRNKPICYPTYRTSALHAGPYNDGWIIAILEVMFYLFCLSTIRITLHDIYIWNCVKWIRFGFRNAVEAG